MDCDTDDDDDDDRLTAATMQPDAAAMRPRARLRDGWNCNRLGSSSSQPSVSVLSGVHGYVHLTTRLRHAFDIYV